MASCCEDFEDVFDEADVDLSLSPERTVNGNGYTANLGDMYISIEARKGLMRLYLERMDAVKRARYAHENKDSIDIEGLEGPFSLCGLYRDDEIILVINAHQLLACASCRRHDFYRDKMKIIMDMIVRDYLTQKIENDFADDLKYLQKYGESTPEMRKRLH